VDLGIEGRRALVAASSTGLGRETARALHEAGCRVVVTGRDRGRLDAAIADIGGGAPVVADLSTVAGAESLVAQTREALGGIDILVANNGGPPAGGFASTDVSAYQTAIDLNLLAMVALCKAAVPDMQARRWGRVVAITSISVRQPIASLILSNTARAGLTGFLKTLALEVARDGVTVNSVQPGLHGTDRLAHYDLDELAASVPAGRIGEPGDFGAVTAFLCSEQAKFITGAALAVDGGQHAGLQ